MKALVTGVTGQDGSYLSEFLLEKGYEVHGIKRRSSSFNTTRIDHIFEDAKGPDGKFHLHYGDLTDSLSIIGLIEDIRPDEIYNLGAQSHVAVSFDNPLYSADVDALGTLRILEAIKKLNLQKSTRVYQASSSELYGLIQDPIQSESTPFYPRSPYAVSKLFSYWIIRNYREAFGLFASNGILFNHESPRRGETFVTRKITRGLANIVLGIDRCLYLGNMGALRDWGHARDYVEAQWLILQHDEPDDFVIATGKQISVRDFVQMAAEELGLMLGFEGEGLDEKGIVLEIRDKAREFKISVGDVLVRVDPRYFRPSEVENLIGDPSKAKKILGWSPRTDIADLCGEMVQEDLRKAREFALVMGAREVQKG